MVVSAPQHRIVDEARRRHRALPGATPFALRLPDGAESVSATASPT